MRRNVTVILHSGEGVSTARGTWEPAPAGWPPAGWPPAGWPPAGWLLTYDEPAETGLGPARTELLFTEGAARLTRTGTVRAVFCFDPGAPCSATYETPYGVFPAQLVTHALRARLGERGGLAELRYTLTIGGAPQERQLKILVRTEEGQ